LVQHVRWPHAAVAYELSTLEALQSKQTIGGIGHVACAGLYLSIVDLCMLRSCVAGGLPSGRTAKRSRQRRDDLEGQAEQKHSSPDAGLGPGRSEGHGHAPRKATPPGRTWRCPP